MGIQPVNLKLEDLPKEFVVTMPEGTDDTHISALKESLSSQLLYNSRDGEVSLDSIHVDVLERDSRTVKVRIAVDS